MPNTGNIGLEVPATGSMAGTWGQNALNPNFAALDGSIAGATVIAVSNTPVTLTAPSGPVISPSSGPYQVYNRTLIVTGTLTANVQITLPYPGLYQIYNQTLGNFVLSFRSSLSGKVVATPSGSVMDVMNNGMDCWLTKDMFTASLVFLAGVTTVPTWINSCSLHPYLNCDGSIYSVASFPHLGAMLGSLFGGNGITTFATPDLRGRVPLAYDGTGTRITVAGAGFNGQVIGAAGGVQSNGLVLANLPPITPAGSVSSSFSGSGFFGGSYNAPAAFGADFTAMVNQSSTGVVVNGSVSSSFTGSAGGGSSTSFSNTQPSQVAGIWLIAT